MGSTIDVFYPHRSWHVHGCDVDDAHYSADFLPGCGTAGVNLIWFGLFVLMTFEMAGTTPPFGLLLYVMLGVAPKGTTLYQVAASAFPFLVCDAILILLMVKWPMIALWLPGLMG